MGNENGNVQSSWCVHHLSSHVDSTNNLTTASYIVMYLLNIPPWLLAALFLIPSPKLVRGILQLDRRRCRRRQWHPILVWIKRHVPSYSSEPTANSMIILSVCILWNIVSIIPASTELPLYVCQSIVSGWKVGFVETHTWIKIDNYIILTMGTCSSDW